MKSLFWDILQLYEPLVLLSEFSKCAWFGRKLCSHVVSFQWGHNYQNARFVLMLNNSNETMQTIYHALYSTAQVSKKRWNNFRFQTIFLVGFFDFYCLKLFWDNLLQLNYFALYVNYWTSLKWLSLIQLIPKYMRIFPQSMQTALEGVRFVKVRQIQHLQLLLLVLSSETSWLYRT